MKVNSSRKVVYTVVVFSVGLLISLALLFGKPKPEPVKDIPLAATAVDVLVVRPAARSLTVHTQGTVQPRREIDLITRVSGTVKEVSDSFADGGFIDSGAQLLSIDDSDYHFALVRAEARVAEAAQLLAAEKGRTRQARREWRDLGNQEANELFLRKPQLASTEAAYLAAQADRDEALLNLERTTIKAPFDGRIRETYVDIGQYVNAGTKIARFYSTDVVEVRLPLTDRQLTLIDLPVNGGEEDRLAVTLTATMGGQTGRWQGYITRTDASIDVESRVFYAVAEVPRPFENQQQSQQPSLAIGMYVEADIEGRKLENIVILPRKALRAERKVWLLDENQQLLPIGVEVLYSDGERVAVRGPFGESARVIISSLNVAVAGMKLSSRNSEDVAEVQ